MQDLELTPNIKAWLDTPAADRDLEAGAELLLRVTRNRILYGNVTRNIKHHADTIEYHLRKIYNQRVEAQTRENVRAMVAQVEKIAAVRHLASSPAPPRSEAQSGKRADHDDLPPEIQKLYTDNADIMRRMRECHVQLRAVSAINSTCPDSDRYPWAKEILALDKQYRDNWNVYDHYVKGTPVAEAKPVVDARTASRNAEKSCHLMLGQYSRNPSEALAARIRKAYSECASPSPRLVDKMATAKLI